MNIIDAIYNLVTNQITNIVPHYISRNRANGAGDAFEEYIKDLFTNAFNLPDADRLEAINNTFSYVGNNSNPPDAMLRGGDAIEIKKTENIGASLALNSSHPRNKLRNTDPMISTACRLAENWTSKDVIYAVGFVSGNQLKHLSMVYGHNYCASEECYSRIRRTIINGVQAIPNVEFAETDELGRINRVDPLGITYLRVRGMWGIENPTKVFRYVYERDATKTFTFMCIIDDEKWNSFNNIDLITKLNNPNLMIQDVRIKDPNNPANLINAKLINFFID